MLNRFEGEQGRRLRVEALSTQKLVGGNKALAEELADLVELRELKREEALIVQNGSDNDIFFILTGSFGVSVNGRRIASRGPNDHVGEMVAIEPTQRRSATVAAEEESVVARISEPAFDALGHKYPELYKYIAKELSRRLLQRNSLVKPTHEKIRVFIISSAEALPVARLVQSAFSHDSFDVIMWSDGVFKVTNYTLQTLEDEVDKSDFAIAVAHADDLTESRGKDWPAPRDNVIFELGLFMGRLGRQRAILMEPREEKIKLPSDLAGVTTILYRYEKGADAASFIAPACNELRTYIESLGPNN